MIYKTLFWLAVLAVPACTATSLEYEAELDGAAEFDAYLVSYRSDGLKLHAMIAVPKSPMPAGGYPVILANHGYVPEPQNYGITDGRNSRPGDYYRSVPALYASRGFMVLLPDYRGHNTSEGYEQIKDQSRSALTRHVDKYADDVVALLALIGEVKNANPDRLFMWSHSMGGGVALAAMLRTGIVGAASFWSPMDLDGFVELLGGLKAPVIIHHATGDQSTGYRNSEEFAAALHRAGKAHAFYSYDSAEHFFPSDLRDLAAGRDVDFFRSAP